MSEHDYDLFVIGGGSGGVRAARVSASLGARVGLAEERELGGTCVNLGCVPKKLLVYGARYAAELEDAAGYGWTVGERSFDWAALIAAKDREIARLNGVYGRMLDRAGVEVVEGRATLIGPHRVRVGEREVSARHVLVATGSWPNRPSIPGAEHAITSNEIFHVPAMPRRVVIGGGGYIAVEFAGILHGLGAEVTLVHRGERVLRGFDEDLRAFLGDRMIAQGVDLRLRTTIERIERRGGGLAVETSAGDTLEVDTVLCAMGRVPNTAGLGLEEVGVELGERGGVVVDAHYQTRVPWIHALGDVIDDVQLTPVALAEGTALARTLFGDQGPVRVDYAGIPTAVFSTPNLATVGLTEAQARERHAHVDVYRSEFRPMKHALTGRDDPTLMKTLVDRDDDRVLGFHMVGPDAGEIIQGLAVALKCGVTKAQLDATIGIHPTAAEEFVTMRSPVPQRT